MKSEPTSAAIIEFVTFNKFLTKVPIKYVNNYMYAKYYENTRSGYSFFDDGERAKDEADWVKINERNSKLFKESQIDYLQQLLVRIEMQVKSKPYSYQNEVEDLAVKQVMEFGVPTMAVNIANRTWMVTDPNDFMVLCNRLSGKRTLVCLEPFRNKIVRYLSKREEQAIHDKARDVLVGM